MTQSLVEQLQQDKKVKVEELKQLKLQIDELYRKQEELEKEIDECIIYQNEDGTWTRFTKTDNLQKLAEGEMVWKITGVSRYSTKIETLKNKPSVK